MTVEFESLGNKNSGAFLELHKPVATFVSPNVALSTMLVLELLSVSFGGLHGLQIGDEFDFLVETFRLGSYPRHSSGSVHTALEVGQEEARHFLPINLTPACARMSFSNLLFTSSSSTGSPDFDSTQPTYNEPFLR